MHENRRYVKLSLIGLIAASALFFPMTSGAELVSSSRGASALAFGPGATPSVAYVDGCALYVARRISARWTRRLAVRCLALAPSGLELAGAVVDAHGRVSVLARNAAGSKLVLVRQTASGFRQQTVVRTRTRGTLLGAPGIALDPRGSPVVAYALRRASLDTFLRLVRVGRGGRLVATPITLRGFPSAMRPPAAAPVLVRGRIHVIEAFGTEAIEWIPQNGRKWLGQFLFSSIRGDGFGPVYAAAAGGATWTAATLLEPEFGESDVLLTQRADTETTSTVFTHAQVAALAVAAGQPEIAANEAVPVGDGTATAGLLADVNGATTELDGAIEGYAVGAGGARNVLLVSDRGIEWFASPARPSVQVELQGDATGAVSGRVVGASGGSVDVFREAPGLPRTLVATVPLARDGSFSANDQPVTSPTLYRAVYRDPATGIPYARLLRTPVGPAGN